MDLRLRTYPDPILEKVCEPVGTAVPDISERVHFMTKLMVQKIGAGIAAPQVGWDARLFVVSGDVLGGNHRFFINPRVEFPEEDNEEVTMHEGCLSIPKLGGSVTRPSRIKLFHEESPGEEKEEEFVGVPARVMQHEMDHLNGILFFKRMSEADQRLIERRLRKMRRKVGKK